MIYVGIDWAEAHHDVCVMDHGGGVLTTRRIDDSLEGVAELHELLGEHAQRPEEIAIGIETDRGLLVGALVAAGYRVHALNPKMTSRYRDRHGVSGAKSDAGDALVLADAIRTDAHLHRTVAESSPEVTGRWSVVAPGARPRSRCSWRTQLARVVAVIGRSLATSEGLRPRSITSATARRRTASG